MRIQIKTIALVGGSYTTPGQVVEVDDEFGAALLAQGHAARLDTPVAVVDPVREETIERAVQPEPEKKAVTLKGRR